MTDTKIILEILKDRRPHHVLEIIQRGKPGAVAWAVRSRISDIRKMLLNQNLTVSTVLDPETHLAIYQIVPLQGELLPNG